MNNKIYDDDNIDISGRYIFKCELERDIRIKPGNNFNFDNFNNLVILSFKFPDDIIDYIINKCKKNIETNILYYIDDLHNFEQEKKDAELKIIEEENKKIGYGFSDFNPYYDHSEEEYDEEYKDIYYNLEQKIEQEQNNKNYYNYYYKNKLTDEEKLKDYYNNPDKYKLNIFNNIFSKCYYKYLIFLYVRFYNRLSNISFEIFNKDLCINYIDEKNILHKLIIKFHSIKNYIHLYYILLYEIIDNKYILVESWKKFNDSSNIYYCSKLYFNPIDNLHSLSFYSHCCPI